MFRQSVKEVLSKFGKRPMMDYTPKARATRQRILDAASEVMLQKGFTRTKLDEVLEISRVRKGNFYYYFASKDDLGLAVLRETAAPIVAKWVAGIVEADKDPVANLKALAQSIAASPLITSGLGNPVANLACEMVEISDEFRVAVGEILMSVTDVYIDQFRALASQDRLQGGYSAEELGRFVVSLVEGSVMVYRRNNDAAQLERTIQIGMNWVLGGIGQNGASV
jgi:TetR/AcrR family transcriptional regulator, transcriptional repressor for nem operon